MEQRLQVRRGPHPPRPGHVFGARCFFSDIYIICVSLLITAGFCLKHLKRENEFPVTHHMVETCIILHVLLLEFEHCLWLCASSLAPVQKVFLVFSVLDLIGRADLGGRRDQAGKPPDQSLLFLV